MHDIGFVCFDLLISQEMKYFVSLFNSKSFEIVEKKTGGEGIHNLPIQNFVYIVKNYMWLKSY